MASELDGAVRGLVLESFKRSGSKHDARIGEIRAGNRHDLALRIARQQRCVPAETSYNLRVVAAHIDVMDEYLLADKIHHALVALGRRVKFCHKSNMWYLKYSASKPGHGSAKSRGTVRRNPRRGNGRVGVPRLA